MAARDELEDRMAISDLVNTYAQAVDRKDAGRAASLFAEDGRLTVWSSPGSSVSRTLSGREAIAEALKGLDRYRATFHEISNHTVELGADDARAWTSCVAHHVSGPLGEERDRVWYLHYIDKLIRGREGWRFRERELRVDVVKESRLIQE